MGAEVVAGTMIVAGAALSVAGAVFDFVRNPGSRLPLVVGSRFAVVLGLVLYAISSFEDFHAVWLTIAAAASIWLGAFGLITLAVRRRRQDRSRPVGDW